MSDNENENSETSADIADEIRRAVESMGDELPYTVSAGTMRRIADRIEAAWEREARAIATEHAVLPAVCITKPSGNAEAMREACKKILDLLMLRGDGKTRCVLTWDEFNESQKMLRAALSAPARNCDVKYADRMEMYGAFKDWCRARGHTMEPMLAYDAFEWLLSFADQKGEGDGR